MLTFYRKPGLSPGVHSVTLSRISSVCENLVVKDVFTELCFFVQLNNATFGEFICPLLWINERVCCNLDSLCVRLSTDIPPLIPLYDP